MIQCNVFYVEKTYFREQYWIVKISRVQFLKEAAVFTRMCPCFVHSTGL